MRALAHPLQQACCGTQHKASHALKQTHRCDRQAASVVALHKAQIGKVRLHRQSIALLVAPS